MAKKKTPAKELTQKEKGLRAELLSQMVTLSTSGFGLVAALAWNEAIQTFVKDYIQPFFPDSAFYYKLMYALVVTLFAVLITYQLSRIAAKFSIEAKKS